MLPLPQEYRVLGIILHSTIICSLNSHIFSNCKGNNPLTAAKIKECTDRLVNRWKSRTFYAGHIEIWTRAVQGSAAVAGNAIGGICHTFLLIDAGPYTYLLERLEEGIRFIELDDNQVVENRLAAQRIYKRVNLNLSSKDIGEWIEEQQKSDYSLIANNCIHFVFQFGRDFRLPGHLFEAGFINFVKTAGATLLLIPALIVRALGLPFIIAWYRFQEARAPPAEGEQAIAYHYTSNNINGQQKADVFDVLTALAGQYAREYIQTTEINDNVIALIVKYCGN